MLAEQQTGPILSLKLSLADDAEDYSVEQIELQSEGMRHSIKATCKNPAICTVLDPDFVIYVKDLLKRLTASRMVYTDTEAQYFLPRLSLKSVQLVSSVRGKNLKMVVLRFMDVVGDVQQILRRSVSPATAESRSIAVDAIEDVVGKSYDVARVYEQFLGFAEPSPMFDGCTKEILVKRNELLFRLDLLKRAVAQPERRVKQPRKIARGGTQSSEFARALLV
jgi:hypothetical protein